MGSAKRKRHRANRQARLEAIQPVPEVTDTALEALLADVIIRTDCEHASTRTTDDGPVLIRCAVDASVAGGCLRDCPRFERRTVGGIGPAFGGPSV